MKRTRRRRHGITVVKLGGSYAASPDLKPWLAAMAACAGRVVIVPGGGPFADAVRAAQATMGFPDGAAHHMALLAMDQYGCALASIGQGLVRAASTAAIARALRQGEVPIWSPIPMVLKAGDVPSSWDVTSDSLAAWLAGKIRAERILLVKQSRPTGPSIRAQDLAAQGIVDPAFPGFLAASGAAAAVAGPADHAAAAAAIRSGAMFGTMIELS